MGDKDEKKQLAPFFPSMHITHGDKGVYPGPRPSLPGPPGNGCSNVSWRNVCTVYPKKHVFTFVLEFPMHVLCAIERCWKIGTKLVTLAAITHVAGVKRKARPISAATNPYPPSSDLYYALCSGGVTASPNYPNPMKSKCITVQPPCSFASYTHCCTDENDFGVSSFLQSYGNLQLQVKKERFDGFSPVMRHHSESNSLIGNRVSDPGIGAMQRNHLTKNRSDFPLCLEFKSVANGMSARKSTPKLEDSTRSSPRGGECEQWPNVGLIMEGSNDNDPSEEEAFDSYTEGSILGLDLSRDEVALVIGLRLFLKARKTMVHQQKTFSLQMFELHRLTTVQRHIARSPEILDPNKPSIEFPPISKLLYVSPVDPSPSAAKAKIDTLKSDLATECGMLPFPTTDFKKEPYFPQPLVPKPLPLPLPNPPSIPIDPKLSPWCIPMSSGNQWLVPVRSPSEGLIYKPYPGPCLPSVGFVAPGYGNWPSVGLRSLGGGGASYSVIPPPNEHADEGYLQPFAMPVVNPSGLNPELNEFDKTSSIGNSNLFKVLSENGVVSECGGNLHRSNGNEMQGSGETSPTERLDGDALALFPTTSSLQPLKNEQKLQAIKAVPHKRLSASASAARIFQSIQEGRRKND